MTTPPVVLTVAGTDSGGAAGIAADLATIGHHGCHGACVVTAITARDTTGVHAVHAVPLHVVDAQLSAVLGDLPVTIVKTGMLGSPAVVELVADTLGHLPIVVDPVLVATSGAVLGDRTVVKAYVEHLLPRAGRDAQPRRGPSTHRTRRIAPPTSRRGWQTSGARWCSPAARRAPTGSPSRAGPRDHSPTRALDTTNDHGTGCTHSSALAAHLALGATVAEAAARAAAYTYQQLHLSHTAPRPRTRTDRTHHPRRNLMTVHPAHERIATGEWEVPVTRVSLTNGETFDRYCTTGPGSDPEVGLPGRRT
ncbi:hydroxymethylpyrimidine/phosphomethylpyrimidine kinase [Nocardioides sp. B-3]|uniref:hydroxymethylpyrimidine/phosphomethylpyrimidine kinase n=1 Tax=Nocardioides sp. B-3 TaxID=2895565 RepID=UPI0021524CA5|nr:hydroxymethylpyrimidine/phosphomethylpyrimidine kinase [Nocardioides sp. B-3]UUZ60257.1 hydroxymethylpyrimidine/phosphomethylpyrimidine kinase [Nocardioides sp. B-3]